MIAAFERHGWAGVSVFSSNGEAHTRSGWYFSLVYGDVRLFGKRLVHTDNFCPGSQDLDCVRDLDWLLDTGDAHGDAELLALPGPGKQLQGCLALAKVPGTRGYRRQGPNCTAACNRFDALEACTLQQDGLLRLTEIHPQRHMLESGI